MLSFSTTTFPNVPSAPSTVTPATRVACPTSATYTCVATSGPTTDTATTLVMAEEEAECEEGEEEVVTWATSMMVEEGEVAVLPCHTGGRVRWERREEELPATPR